jgi:hypothetical protein
MVLHDWPDAQAQQILADIAAAGGPRARLMLPRPKTIWFQRLAATRLKPGADGRGRSGPRPGIGISLRGGRDVGTIRADGAIWAWRR